MLKSGSAPEWVFVCKAVNGLVTLPDDGKQVMLLFTAPSAAKDYIDCVKLHAQVGQLKVDALPESARKWLAAGAAVFALNRCPRCSAFTTFAMESLIQGHYFDAWALIRALQWLRGEASMQEYMGLSSRKSLQQGRAVLE